MRSFRFFVPLAAHIANGCKYFETMKKESVVDVKNSLLYSDKNRSFLIYQMGFL